MEQEDTYRAALVRAAEILGGARALCDRVHVPMPELTRWLAGDGKPTIGIFLKVIDILIEEGQTSHFTPASNDAEKPIKLVK
jgi:hypothetical protein